MSIRVLHVIPAVAARYGGPSAATVGICRALRTAGMRTLMATTDADGTGRLPVTVDVVQTHEGVPTIFFRRQLGESFKWSAPFAKWLRTHVADHDVVHIHAVFNHASLAAGRACRLAQVPYIVRPLGTLDPWSLARHPRRKRLLLALGARRLLSGAAAIHYTTAEEQRLAQQGLPWLPRGVVVPLGIDEELFETPTGNESTRKPVVVSMARLDPKKGLEVLIDAFHVLARSSSLGAWRLVIAGDGEPAYVAHLEELASQGAARERIEFRGWVAGAARRELLGTSRLFALPSRTENFGIALVEAMACGLPVIVSPGVNLAQELNTSGAGWVAECTNGVFAETLRTAISHGHALDERGRCARRFAERFRWVSVAEALRSMYDDVLRRPAPYLPRDFSPAAQQ